MLLINRRIVDRRILGIAILILIPVRTNFIGSKLTHMTEFAQEIALMKPGGTEIPNEVAVPGRAGLFYRIVTPTNESFNECVDVLMLAPSGSEIEGTKYCTLKPTQPFL